MSSWAGPAAGLAAISRALTVSAAAAGLGMVFALGLYNAWELDTRWFVVVIIAIVGISAAMLLTRVFSDFVLVFALFTISVASFSKWFWPTKYAEDERGNLVYSGLLGIGLLDFIVIGLYMSWFYRVFALRERPSPGLLNTDWFLLAYLIIHLLSSIGAADPELALGATEYLTKYALFYFYVSRNLAPRHLPWLIGALGFAIFLEAMLGSVQFSTGKLLGIALDKGAGTSEVDYQYSVPGIETYKRATGTSYDSHSLGNFMAMMLPFPLVLYFTPRLRPSLRALYAGMAVLATLAIFMTLSRAAWLSTGISLGIGIILIVMIWREREVIPMLIAVGLISLAVLPFMASFIYDRFADSPHEVLTTRYDQYEVALQVVRLYPFLGFGPGNWIQALHRHDFLWLEVLPPHNVLLWITAETGIVGMVCYLGVLVTTAIRLIRLIRTRRDLVGRLGMAVLIALITTVLVGLTDPTYREPTVFTMFWTLIALSVALPRMPILYQGGTSTDGSTVRSLAVV
jgi:putative inorganic carbon (hco3(-)) transporter